MNLNEDSKDNAESVLNLVFQDSMYLPVPVRYLLCICHRLRSSCPEVKYKIGLLKILKNFQENIRAGIQY